MAVKRKKAGTPTGKARIPSSNPYEDLRFVVEDTFALVDEVCEELEHIEKQVSSLEKKAKNQQAVIEKLRKQLSARGKLR